MLLNFDFGNNIVLGANRCDGFALFNNNKEVNFNSSPALADEFRVFAEFKIIRYKLIARLENIFFSLAGKFSGSSRGCSVSYCKNRVFKALTADFIADFIALFFAEGLKMPVVNVVVSAAVAKSASLIEIPVPENAP